MKKISLLTTCLFFIGINILCAQQLYMPRNITNAIKNGTRSMDGNPGKITGRMKASMIST
jgi:hypothetical protein